MPNGWAGVQAGAAIVFFAYIGFDAVSTVAEETQKSEPRSSDRHRRIADHLAPSSTSSSRRFSPASFRSTCLETEARDRTGRAADDGAAIREHRRFANLFVGIVAFGSVVAHTAVLLVFQLGQPRIFFSMARDGLLPPVFAKVHPRFRTPHVTTILTGVAVGVCAMFTSIDEMVDLTNIGTLFAFILVCIGILVLETREPERRRTFRRSAGAVAFPCWECCPACT